MKHKKTIYFLVITAFTVAAVIGFSAYRSASAQEATPTTPAGDDSTQLSDRPGRRGFVDNIKDVKDEALANALGISVDELTSARQSAKEAMLAQAVDDGLITQAQADALTQNGRAFPFDGRWAGWLTQNGMDYETFLADALGISVDELQAAKASALSAELDQAVADGLLTQEKADLIKGRYALANDETFQTSMQSAFESAVKQAVTDGVITQAQADQILANNVWSGGKGGFLGGILGGLDRHGHGEWGERLQDQAPAP